MILYIPPYSKNVGTNIAGDFLQVIVKHFPRSNKLHKLFNRHTVRVSYSYMDNMKNFIRKHNNRTLTQNAKRNNTTQQTMKHKSATADDPTIVQWVESVWQTEPSLPGWSYDKRQQRNENIHRFNSQRLQAKIQQPLEMVPWCEILKRDSTFKIYLEIENR